VTNWSPVNDPPHAALGLAALGLAALGLAALGLAALGLAALGLAALGLAAPGLAAPCRRCSREDSGVSRPAGFTGADQNRKWPLQV